MSNSIAIVGYGYWGKTIHSILERLNFSLSYIFSSNQNNNRLLDAECYDYSSLNDKELMKNISHMFLLTGPSFHNAILKKLYSTYKQNELPYLWVEKPFFIEQISKQNYNHLERVFVDYPYIHQNLNCHFDDFFSSHDAAHFEIGIFSRNLYNRKYPIIFDFAPHVFTLIHLITNKLCLSSFYEISIDIETNNSNNKISPINNCIYSFKVKCMSSNILFSISFGAGTSRNSYITKETEIGINKYHYINPSQKHTLNNKSLKTIELSKLFKNPVNENVLYFINDYSPDRSQINRANLNPLLHRKIYEYSANLFNSFKPLL